MQITPYTNGSFFYTVIDDMYSEHEIALIHKELEFLQLIKQSPDKTNTAHTNGKLLKTGDGLFLDGVYSNRETSVILTLNRRLFSEEVTAALEQQNCFYRHIRASNKDSTLINFYGNMCKYDAHTDLSIFTAVTFFKIGTFLGGEFCFPHNDVEINPVAGRVVIFPGCVMHQAKPIRAEEGNYRITMAQFINYKET